MLLHTVIDPMAVMEQPVPPRVRFEQRSPFCFCEWVEGEEGARLRRGLSTDPGEYLGIRMQPGARPLPNPDKIPTDRKNTTFGGEMQCPILKRSCRRSCRG